MARPTPVFPLVGSDDRIAGLEPAVGLGSLDHGETYAVLHGATGVDVLDLGDQVAGRMQPGKPHKRGIPDDGHDVVEDLHEPRLGRYAVTGTGAASGSWPSMDWRSAHRSGSTSGSSSFARAGRC